MALEKIKEEMWCRNCEHLWVTEDYFGNDQCPNCQGERTYRTSSTSYAYAWMSKQKEKEGKQFTCPDCATTTYHPNDIEKQFCGNCNTFPEDRAKKHGAPGVQPAS